MSDLPPLNPPDGALLTRFLLNHEDPLSLLPDSTTDLLAILAFLARPDVNAWLDHFHALQSRARQNIAASVLLELLRDSNDPVQRRLAANALFQQSSRPTRSPATGSPQPRPHPARSTTPDVPPADPPRHRHAVERPPEPPRASVSAPCPAQPVFSSAPLTPAPDDHPAEAPSEHTALHDSTPAPAHDPGASPPTPSPLPAAAPSMTFDQAMAALGIDPALLDIADEIEDAVLDGDLAEDLEHAALTGSLGRALQRAAEEGTLDEALEDAIDRGDHLSDHRLAAAFNASRAPNPPDHPDG